MTASGVAGYNIGNALPEVRIMPATIEILGDFNPDQLYCAASVTKMLTTFVVLSFLADKNYDLDKILDDENFLDSICHNLESKEFLQLFQDKVGSKFTLRDACSYYSGLPYTFDLSPEALEKADRGEPFKHHSLLDEKTFLDLCKNHVTPVYGNRQKYNYSEISIIFLAYLIEKAFDVKMEDLYKTYLTGKFELPRSHLSRTRPAEAYTQDMTLKYDYPAAAIQDHGFFCYSNGFYTTLNETKKLLENIVNDKTFQYMIDLKHARSTPEPRLMNGLSIELKTVGKDDLIFGYSGLSFSGCNAWLVSAKSGKGCLTFCDTSEEADAAVYEHLGYGDVEFDEAPEHAEIFYSHFKQNYPYEPQAAEIPSEYQGNYQRVKMNDTELSEVFVLGKSYLEIRDPGAKFTYNLTKDVKENYRVIGEDQTHEAKLSLHQAKSGNPYMFYQGNLYRKIKAQENTPAESLEESKTNKP